MPQQSPPPVPPPSASPEETVPRYRSGAVARMLRMPVATLRIWERRYRVASPATTPSGHRLYCAADVQRLALLKQLTDHGHAIGSIAALGMEELRQVAATHASTLADSRGGAAPGARPLQLVVVGAGLARRLQRPALLRLLGRPLQVRAVFDSLGQAAEGAAGRRADALLVQAPGLHEGGLEEVQAAARSWGARRMGLLYGYASAAAAEGFAAAGAALLREPQDEPALAAWLQGLCGPAEPPGPAADDRGVALEPPVSSPEAVAPRRYDDAVLADIAGLSSTLACECPRHLAELLMQLSHFEAYSAECRHRSPADAALHAYLQQVAGSARALLETALERVAIQEGLMLPRTGAGSPRRRGAKLSP